MTTQANGNGASPSGNGDGEPSPRPASPGAGSDPDATLTAYLSACDEALAAGRTPPPCPPEVADPELRRRLRQARDCLNLIQQLWPRDGEPGQSTGSILPTLGADETWFDEGTFHVPNEHIVPEEDAGAAGATRLGRFRVVRELGRGGFGAVFLAEDPRLDRLVALKVPLVDVLTRPGVRRRFLNEAKAAAALDHPNLVQVYEAGVIGPICYIASVYCDGPTLAEWMVEQPRPIRARSAVRLVAELAGAIQHVHERGFLHRDLKPSNVLLQHSPLTSGAIDGWVPKITDFGLARVLDDSGEATQTGLPVGSPAYMAPEQAQGRVRDLSPATDVYALGVMLYELLLGRTPHIGETPLEILRLVVGEEPMPPRRRRPDLPRDLEAIVLHCLEKDPRRRYPTAAALEADLRRFLAGESIAARPVALHERAWKWARRRPFRAAAIVAAALLPLALIVALAGALAWQRAHNEDLRLARLQAEELAKESDRLARQAEQLAAEAIEKTRIIQRHLHNAQVGWADKVLREGKIEQAQDILDGVDPIPQENTPTGIRSSTSGFDPRGFAWGYLSRLARREIRQLRGHDDAHIAAISPDGSTLVSAGTGQTWLWDLAAGRPRVKLGGDRPLAPDWPTISPDGRLVAALATSPDDPTGPRHVGLWDLATGEPLATLHLPETRGDGWDAAGLPMFLDATHLVETWSHDEHGHLWAVWDLADDPTSARLVVERPVVHLVAANRPSDRVAVIDAAGVLTVLDARTGASVRTFEGTFTGMPPWSISADGRTLLAPVAGRGVVLWDTDTGAERVAHDDLTAPIQQVVLSPDGRTFAVVEASGRVHLLHADGGRGPSLMPDDLDRPARGVNLAFSPDGARLALTAYGHPHGRGPLRIFEVADGRVTAVFPGRREIGTELVFAPDGRSLWVVAGPTLREWVFDPADASEPVLGRHGDEAWAVAFSPNGETIASGGDDDQTFETLTLWDAATGARRDGWRAHPAGTVSALAYRPDGTMIATAAFETSDNLRLWDPSTGRLLASLPGHTAFVRALAFHPEGRLLASAGTDRAIRIWDVEARSLVQTLTDPTDTIRALAFSPDGRRMVSVGNDSRLRLWDVATWRPLLDLPQLEFIATASFNHDGTMLAVADEDGAIRLLDPETCAVLGVLHDQGELRCLAFSPDGKLLASGGMPGVVSLWDPVTRERVLELDAPVAQVNALAFSPDGLTLVAAAHDGTVHRWRADPTPVPGNRDGGDDPSSSLRALGDPTGRPRRTPRRRRGGRRASRAPG